MKKNEIEMRIESLLGKSEVKEKLSEINQVCIHADSSVKMGIPGLCLIAKDGSGINYVADIYAEMVSTHYVLAQRCARKLLELTYEPGMEREELYRILYKVKTYADTQNHFYGTCLLHMVTSNEKDEYSQEEMQWIIDFIKKNRNNMKFVIHISPQISNYENVLCLLRQNILVETINFDYPTVEEWTEYMLDALKDRGISMNVDSKKIFADTICELVEKKYFKGYTTMNHLIIAIGYECAAKKYGTRLNEQEVTELRTIMLHEEMEQTKGHFGFA